MKIQTGHRPGIGGRREKGVFKDQEKGDVIK